ncbi:MAG: IS1 family transposase [Ignavibacteria bacterium]|nr:IS1 family transposase [Ignavibacteria bacterium]MBI3766328.1 IS1 family transposase [Ignavibacteriales bacterium]
MNKLSVEKQVLILSLLAEGNSLRTISRVSGVARNTISKLLLEAGEKAREIMNREMVNLKVNYLQVDEIWTFVGKKQKRLQPHELDTELGDQYVFVALDAESKLVPTFRVGKRTSQMAASFMMELRTRINTTFQLSTDSFGGYRDAVDRVFGEDIHYGQVHKMYAEESQGEKRYSPAPIVRVIINPITGYPDRKHISTSFIERQNLTMRMQMRRFTRLTNAFSKSLKHLEAALALHFFHYNFMRLHETIRVTPAMQAGISKHLMTWEEFWGWGNEEKKAA